MVGLHVSAAGSPELAFDRARELGATTFQIFTRNPNQWKFNPLSEDTVAAFREKRKESGFARIVDHMPYLPNLASPEMSTVKISRYTLKEELKRCDSLGIDYLVVHLGSHLGKGTAVGMANIAAACNEAIAGSEGTTTILLENMAGQKNCVGARFEEIRGILDRVDESGRVGVCLDSCHAFASGFDLTILQPTAYMQNILGAWQGVTSDGVFRVPYPVETRLCLVDLDDVAAAAAAVVLTQDGHAGVTYELVGTDPLSQLEVAGAIGAALKRDVRAEAESVAAWEARARAGGMGEHERNTLAAMFRYYAAYGLVGNSNTLRWLLGRAPNGLELRICERSAREVVPIPLATTVVQEVFDVAGDLPCGEVCLAEQAQLFGEARQECYRQRQGQQEPRDNVLDMPFAMTSHSAHPRAPSKPPASPGGGPRSRASRAQRPWL